MFSILVKKITLSALVASTLFTAVTVNASDLVIAGRDGIYGKALEYSIQKFKKQNPKMDIQLLKLPYSSLYEKLVIGFKGEETAYDVVMIDDTWATEFMRNKWLKDLGKANSDFVEKTLKISRYPLNTGSLYAYPFVGNVEMFAYREDLFKKYNLKADSWSDILKAAKTINTQEEGVNGVVFRGTKGNPIVTGFLPILWAHGGKVIDENGKSALNSKAAKKALSVFLELKKYAPRGVELYNSSEVRDAIQQSKAAIAIEVWPSWIPSMDDESKSKVVRKMAIQAAPGELVSSSPMLGIWQLAITNNSKKAKTAKAFIKFVTSKQNQKSLALNLGLPPTRASVYTDKDIIKKYRWYPKQLEALQNSKERPRIKEWKKVESILGDYLQLALVGQIPANKSLEMAAKDIAKALK